MAAASPLDPFIPEPDVRERHATNVAAPAAVVMGVVRTFDMYTIDVVFRPIPAEEFAAFQEPGLVKIAWTLEVEPLGPSRCRLTSETRVVATDAEARARFSHYWRWARFGIVLIRRLMLPAIRRQAEALAKER